MEGLLGQIAKFGVVGVVATIIDYGVLVALTQAFGVEPVLAAGISFVVSLLFNYVASMRYVFTHRESMSRGAELGIFVVLSVIGLALNEAVMAAGVRLLGDSLAAITATKVAATSIVMVWNFASRKRWLDAGSDKPATESSASVPSGAVAPGDGGRTSARVPERRA